jgi:hypothetical protein
MQLIKYKLYFVKLLQIKKQIPQGAQSKLELGQNLKNIIWFYWNNNSLE